MLSLVSPSAIDAQLSALITAEARHNVEKNALRNSLEVLLTIALEATEGVINPTRDASTPWFQASVIRGIPPPDAHRFRLMTKPVVLVAPGFPTLSRWEAEAVPLRESDGHPHEIEVRLSGYVFPRLALAFNPGDKQEEMACVLAAVKAYQESKKAGPAIALTCPVCENDTLETHTYERPVAYRGRAPCHVTGLQCAHCPRCGAEFTTPAMMDHNARLIRTAAGVSAEQGAA